MITPSACQRYGLLTDPAPPGTTAINVSYTTPGDTIDEFGVALYQGGERMDLKTFVQLLSDRARAGTPAPTDAGGQTLAGPLETLGKADNGDRQRRPRAARLTRHGAGRLEAGYIDPTTGPRLMPAAKCLRELGLTGSAGAAGNRLLPGFLLALAGPNVSVVGVDGEMQVDALRGGRLRQACPQAYRSGGLPS